jgi:hypothetical protein
MSDLDLDAIRERAEKATPGPWESYSVPGRNRSAAGYAAVEVAETEVQVTRDAGGWYDAYFIAHARTDVPALVAEVARLQGIIDRVRGLATHDGQWPRGLSPQGFPGVVSATAVLAILDGEENN